MDKAELNTEKKQANVVGTKVNVTNTLERGRRGFTPKAIEERVAGAFGVVIGCSNSHGLCFEVRHDEGSVGWYDADELKRLGYGKFRLFSNGVDTIAARSLDEACQFGRENLDFGTSSEDDLSEVRYDFVYTVHDVNKCEDWLDGKKSQTAAEWANECTEPCHVGSTEH